jgi:hypothetical protein
MEASLPSPLQVPCIFICTLCTHHLHVDITYQILTTRLVILRLLWVYSFWAKKSTSSSGPISVQFRDAIKHMPLAH